ncbi:uncharacterized protein CANTADRAFT_7549 [Suhomyces tanzawaensis NRRL Y-17324]|uniref:Enhancer of mRNA-decapping protein 1 n=1 Tax=Suhomyces tanzawaensis NRRL Y-17324 TaxID=984487 RepID=A0A1E4SF23_9ASCO|nr:uncharacterized protein CANTADRAFT_7549 [Suhomyces tanzawaensis NRRL Y-17324]ODV78090.1 hypothetical protein CANTADRAFT_7549 [Suhomyces tanzawaensis NRRL Y-17324]
MMAHEIPLPIHQAQYRTPPDKADKNPKNDGDRRLPNGEKVNFGHGSSKPKGSKNATKKDDGSKKKTSRSTSPALPNGSKPNFHHDGASKPKEPAQGKKKGSKSKPSVDAGKKSEPSLPNGDKPNFGGATKAVTSKKTKSAQPKDKKLPAEATYAGSSFHSSPAALALPKPSFKSSTKSSSGPSDEVADSGASSASTASSPSSQVVHPPPQYPVTAYPPGSIVPPNGMPMYPPPQHHMPPNQFIQPGFVYNYTPQGYIQYQYPPGSGHFPQMQPPHPISNPITTHFQQPLPPVGQAPANAHMHASSNGGHKISFNDLLGSSKG